MYAFERSLQVGADMLELDVGVTKDGQVVVMHDTTVDRTTNGHGTVASFTLKQLRKLDAAYWFSGGADAYRHDRARSAYRLRGVATGKRRPPKGFKAADFRVPDAQARSCAPSRTRRSTSRSRAARRPRRSTSTSRTPTPSRGR